MELRESQARVILAIGAYREHGFDPTYGDVARATGRSLSRVRAVVAELRALGLVEKTGDSPTRLTLTGDGWRAYIELKTVLVGGAGKTLDPATLVKLFEERAYGDARRVKPFGAVRVRIDATVPLLRIREVIDRLGRLPSTAYPSSWPRRRSSRRPRV